jgi:hypothetical protein
LRVLGTVAVEHLDREGEVRERAHLTNRRATLLLVVLALERGPQEVVRDLVEL